MIVDPAPIKEFFPILIGATREEFVPTNELSPTLVLFLLCNSCIFCGIGPELLLCVARPTQTKYDGFHQVLSSF